MIDHVSVEKGYETALGAALGDDLDAPVDASSPMHWSNVGAQSGDPTLPEGVEPLGALRQGAGPSWRAGWRRSAWSSARPANSLPRRCKPGQRLVSREGDLWRWDGFVAAAHAPTGAARRLAQRSRLAEIDAELASARAEVEDKRKALSRRRSRLSKPPRHAASESALRASATIEPRRRRGSRR